MNLLRLLGLKRKINLLIRPLYRAAFFAWKSEPKTQIFLLRLFDFFIPFLRQLFKTVDACWLKGLVLCGVVLQSAFDAQNVPLFVELEELFVNLYLEHIVEVLQRLGLDGLLPSLHDVKNRGLQRRSSLGLN